MIVDINRGMTVWFTGLSGAGKSTIVKSLGMSLKSKGNNTITVSSPLAETTSRNAGANIG